MQAYVVRQQRSHMSCAPKDVRMGSRTMSGTPIKLGRVAFETSMSTCSEMNDVTRQIGVY